jgi:hypothetical protein
MFGYKCGVILQLFLQQHPLVTYSMHTSGRSVLKLNLHVNVTEIIIRKDGEEAQKELKRNEGK